MSFGEIPLELRFPSQGVRRPSSRAMSGLHSGTVFDAQPRDLLHLRSDPQPLRSRRDAGFVGRSAASAAEVARLLLAGVVVAGGVTRLDARPTLQSAARSDSKSPSADGGTAAAPPTANPGDAVQPTGEPTSRLASDASFFEAVLSNPASDSAVRRAAAERLVRDRTPEALQAIERILRGKNTETLAPMIESLDRAGVRVPTLAEALIAAIASDRAFDRAAAARVLASSDSRATELLSSAALRGELPNRIGAIAGLGELRTRAAAGRLVAMLDVAQSEPATIVQAVCAALERCTGADKGVDPEAWRLWWDDAASLPVESGVDAALRARVEAAERAVAEERRRGDRLAERLTDAYNQLFLRLTQKERMARSGELLTDALPEVRTFAVSQIERLLRNGERADDAALQAMTVLLDDPLPALRARGVRLLDDLATPDLAQRISARLPSERDPDVRSAYLAALSNRPTSEAFAAVLPLIADPVLGEAASRVAAGLAEAKLLPADAAAQLLPVLRETVGKRPTGPAAQLLATLGDDADIARVTALLDATEPSTRRGAAEGLRRRGVRRPLLERSRDPAIFAPLMASLGDEPRTLTTLDQMISAVPSADLGGALAVDWNAAVAKLLRELPIADLPQADQSLERVPICEPRTRIGGLSRFVTSALGGLRRADVELGLRRYVDLLLAQDRAREAIDQLALLEPKSGDPAHEALFRARVLVGEYVEAAALDSSATAWLKVLESVIVDVARARSIVEEIEDRFPDPSSVTRTGADADVGVMTPTERERFDRLRKMLPATTSAR
jgi:hypothetical protein